MLRHISAMYYAFVHNALDRVHVFLEKNENKVFWNMALSENKDEKNLKTLQSFVNHLSLEDKDLVEDNISPNYRTVEEHLTDRIARIIFLYEGGVYPEEYRGIWGKEKPIWNNGKSYPPDQDNALSETTRDEYRCQARKIIEYLKENGLLNV